MNVGDRIRVPQWDDALGTVSGVDGDSVFVKCDGTEWIETELDIGEVVLIGDAT